MTIADLILELFSDDPLDYDEISSVILGHSGELVNESLVQEEMRQFDSFQKNHDYREEEYGLEHIISGDVQWVKEHMEELIPSHPVFLDNVIKNEEYIAVIAISLVARASIQGGLISQEGFLINDIYLKNSVTVSLSKRFVH